MKICFVYIYTRYTHTHKCFKKNYCKINCYSAKNLKSNYFQILFCLIEKNNIYQKYLHLIFSVLYNRYLYYMYLYCIGIKKLKLKNTCHRYWRTTKEYIYIYNTYYLSNFNLKILNGLNCILYKTSF